MEYDFKSTGKSDHDFADDFFALSHNNFFVVCTRRKNAALKLLITKMEYQRWIHCVNGEHEENGLHWRTEYIDEMEYSETLENIEEMEYFDSLSSLR